MSEYDTAPSAPDFERHEPIDVSTVEDLARGGRRFVPGAVESRPASAPNRPEPASVAEQFTPADVEMIAKVFITEARKNPVTPSPYSWGVTSRLLLGPNEHDIARAVLTALAAAGRLCPPGAREKWSVACQSCSSDGWTPGPGCAVCWPVPTPGETP